MSQEARAPRVTANKSAFWQARWDAPRKLVPFWQPLWKTDLYFLGISSIGYSRDASDTQSQAEKHAHGWSRHTRRICGGSLGIAKSQLCRQSGADAQPTA